MLLSCFSGYFKDGVRSCGGTNCASIGVESELLTWLEVLPHTESRNHIARRLPRPKGKRERYRYSC